MIYTSFIDDKPALHAKLLYGEQVYTACLYRPGGERSIRVRFINVLLLLFFIFEDEPFNN